MKKISIDKLPEEAKKLGIGFQDPNMIKHTTDLEELYGYFIDNLLIPKEFTLGTSFEFDKKSVISLCNETIKTLDKEPMLVI